MLHSILLASLASFWHIDFVRGSPILRTMITALCLGLAALVLRWVTETPEKHHVEDDPPELEATNISVVSEIPFRLSLSAAATQVQLADMEGKPLWQKQGEAMSELQGSLPNLPESLVLQVTWAAKGAPRYFAKVVIDPPGRSSLSHVFDAEGDIDDLWELP
ncbi:MAG: hypothetical protein RLZZ224_1636 [Verrucomicrobiota bacterium]|jgi:hypothetical protein